MCACNPQVGCDFCYITSDDHSAHLFPSQSPTISMQPTSIRALVTGGSSGIGRATAELLVQRGGRVVISARNESALRATATRIGAVPIRADVSDEADVQRLVERAIAELGDYNVLINNAGFGLF